MDDDESAVRNHELEEAEQQEQQEQKRQGQERREEEEQVQGRLLKNSEQTGKRHTQIDMERILYSAARIQMSLSAAGQPQEQRRVRTGDESGRELVAVGPVSDAAHDPHTPVYDPTTEQEESLEQGGFAQWQREQEELEQEKPKAMRQRRWTGT
ncbi:hypothetical protein B7494_g2763 [Chlorociboria aeruginascens]|nr:hypothetical protein B7494_g2763 [Chlorociboria aeruginascens]